MGPRLKYPRYVNGFVDRHGRPRFYFRRRGFKKIPLPGLPWSPEFMAAYEAALTGQDGIEIGACRTKPGTMRALAVSYYNSAAFRADLKPNTQATQRALIDPFCREHGDKSVAGLRREHVIKLMAARAERPGSANALRQALRALMKHAIDIGLRTDNPTRDVKRLRVRSNGHHSWTDAEIEQFEARHPIGSRSRLALALLLYTGQRRGDIIRMGRQHIRDGVLHVRQDKTGVELAIPVHQTLARVLAESSSGQMTFLVTAWGKPLAATSFSHWFRARCDEAGLPHCSAHGLRKAAARRLAEAGCTQHEISAITGHLSLKEVQRYTQAADQKRLAIAAMAKVKAQTSSD
jgi:integrase